MALDLYTRQCSIGVTARQLAVAAATIAFDGVNPVTKQTVFKPDLGTRIASMMATVGFTSIRATGSSTRAFRPRPAWAAASWASFRA